MALRAIVSRTASTFRIQCRSPILAPSFNVLKPFSRGFSHVVEGLKYSESHEWLKTEGDIVTVGITDHAQDHLGDVVFADLPEVGTSVSKGSSFGAVESVKATSDILSPVSGEVVETNEKLGEKPGIINSSPYDEGWIIKVRIQDSSEIDTLMNAEKYKHFCEEEDASH